MAARTLFPSMPRYFFHLYNDIEAIDAEGVELPNIGAARMAAMHDVRFTVAETIKTEGRFVGDHRIDIEDGDGKVLDTIYFRDAVTIEDRAASPADRGASGAE